MFLNSVCVILNWFFQEQWILGTKTFWGLTDQTVSGFSIIKMRVGIIFDRILLRDDGPENDLNHSGTEKLIEDLKSEM